MTQDSNEQSLKCCVEGCSNCASEEWDDLRSPRWSKASPIIFNKSNTFGVLMCLYHKELFNETEQEFEYEEDDNFIIAK